MEVLLPMTLLRTSRLLFLLRLLLSKGQFRLHLRRLLLDLVNQWTHLALHPLRRRRERCLPLRMAVTMILIATTMLASHHLQCLVPYLLRRHRSLLENRNPSKRTVQMICTRRRLRGNPWIARLLPRPFTLNNTLLCHPCPRFHNHLHLLEHHQGNRSTYRGIPLQ